MVRCEAQHGSARYWNRMKRCGKKLGHEKRHRAWDSCEVLSWADDESEKCRHYCFQPPYGISCQIGWERMPLSQKQETLASGLVVQIPPHVYMK